MIAALQGPQKSLRCQKDEHQRKRVEELAGGDDQQGGGVSMGFPHVRYLSGKKLAMVALAIQSPQFTHPVPLPQ